MGLFDFLRKKNPAESVKFTELGPWLDRQVESKRLDAKIESAKQEINQILAEARTSFEALEKASLANPNIPIKEKQIMEGHRKIYLQRMRRFLDEVSVPDDFSQVGHYTARFSENLGRIGEETQKNHIILKQFFDHEVTKAASELRRIEQALASLQASIDREGVEQIKEAKIRLKQYHDDHSKKAKLEQEAESCNNELEMLKNKNSKLGLRLEELKKSREYNEFREYLDEKKRSEDRINEIEQELITLFSDLNRPLKRYTHNTLNEKLADKYIGDPAGALEEDDSLLIHELLKKMLQDLPNLEFKDKQVEKVEEAYNKLSREFLVQKKLELARLKTLNKELASKINRSVVALNISENESWRKSLEHKIAEWEEKLERINKEVDQINLDYLRQKAKEKAKEINQAIIIED